MEDIIVYVEASTKLMIKEKLRKLINEKLINKEIKVRVAEDFNALIDKF